MKSIYLLIMSVFLTGTFVSAQSCCSTTTKSNTELLSQLVNDTSTIIVDVRTPEEFQQGHIEGSINIPLETLAESSTPLKEYKGIVVVCRSGKRAEEGREILMQQGFINVYNGQGWESLNELLKSNN